VSSKSVERHVGERTISLSHLDKPYFAEAGVTKGDVVDYYERIAELMLPHVARRPLVMQRFPEGIDAAGFYQKNTPAHVPDWIRRVAIDTSDGGTTTYSVVDDAAGLVYLANQGALVFHTLLCDADQPARPVEVIFDLDPSSDDLDPVRSAARELRDVLNALDLAPRVKTSGSRGLHVIVDVLDDDADFELTRTFARRVAESIERRGPYTLEHRKARRRGRLFLDVLRNTSSSHAVAPYSLRPLPAAPIAIPLDWNEALDASFHPQRITIDNVFRRLAQKADPWADRPAPTHTITEALAALDDAAP
jgi:bifunctional non-homologous end joining protein LigD